MSANTKGKFPYTTFYSFCIHTPLLPIDFYFKLTSSREVTEEDLREKIKIPMIQEALFLASPDFYFQVIKWLKGDIKDLDKTIRIKTSLLKYLTRMSTRCTPFGMFAGCSTGLFDYETQLEILPYNNYTKHTRYDMHFLVDFSTYLTEKEHIKKTA